MMKMTAVFLATAAMAASVGAVPAVATTEPAPSARDAVGPAPAAAAPQVLPAPEARSLPTVAGGFRRSVMFPAGDTSLVLDIFTKLETGEPLAAPVSPEPESGIALPFFEKEPPKTIPKEVPLPDFRLNSIVLDPTLGWTVIVNKTRLDPQSSRPGGEITVLGVTTDSTTLRWTPSDEAMRLSLINRQQALEESKQQPPSPNRVAARVPAYNFSSGIPKSGSKLMPPSVRFTLRLGQTFSPSYMAIYEGRAPEAAVPASHDESTSAAAGEMPESPDSVPAPPSDGSLLSGTQPIGSRSLFETLGKLPGAAIPGLLPSANGIPVAPPASAPSSATGAVSKATSPADAGTP